MEIKFTARFAPDTRVDFTGDDRIRRYNNRIFELHRAASSVVDEDWDPSNPSLQSACEASPSHCGDEYSFVAASANDLDSSVYRISKQNAEAAHKIAEAEHKQLVASLSRAASSGNCLRLVSRRWRWGGAHTLRKHRTSAERDKREHYKRRAARLAKSPAHARRKSQEPARKDEKIFPDGQDSVNVAGLGAEEHLAAIHADQFHRLLRADSFDDFQDM